MLNLHSLTCLPPDDSAGRIFRDEWTNEEFSSTDWIIIQKEDDDLEDNLRDY
jgi:hypothetical protein